MTRLKSKVVVSTGSACTARSLEPSPVLIAMGLSRERAESAIRIGLGRDTTQDQIDEASAFIVAAVLDLRALAGKAVA